ncbi:hypothetical protein Q8A73_018701 [Channa argus]|nr:hypothetical protein Q8A73_018701 [Channa argus]
MGGERCRKACHLEVSWMETCARSALSSRKGFQQPSLHIDFLGKTITVKGTVPTRTCCAARPPAAQPVSTETTQARFLWRLDRRPLSMAARPTADQRKGVRVEAGARFLAAEAVLTGMEETPIGQTPTLTPQGLSGSRTTSSLAPLDINECT